MRIIDITRPIAATTAPWPGDVPFSIEWVMRRSKGHPVNLTRWSMSPHFATHADAPVHVRDDGQTISDLDLSAFIGPARVLDVSGAPNSLIPPEVLDGIALDDPPRILFKTGTHPDSTKFPDAFAALSPEAADRLVAGGTRLVGMDTPGVDPLGAERLESHERLADGGAFWLENLDLGDVSPGIYEFIALPLRIVGGCGSPVRAVLVER